MNKKTTYTLHILLVALVTLTGVLPVVPAAAAPDQPLPLAETRQQTIPLAPLAMDRAVSENAAPTQGFEAVDPGAWTQEFPDAVSDVDSNTFIVWQDYREGGGLHHIRFAERPAGGEWQSSIKLDPTAAGSQEYPQIAMDGSSNLYAIWEDHRRQEDEPLIYFTYKPVGGDWSVSAAVSNTTGIQEGAALAVNRRGEAVVSWRQRPDNGVDYTVFSIIRSVDGNWSTPEPKSVEPGEFILGTGVAIDDWGRVYLAWDNWNSGDILFAERSPDGSWSANEQIRDDTTDIPWGTQIATDGAGNVHAVWEDARSGGSQIYAAYRPAGGPWSVNVRLDEGNGYTYSPGIGIDAAGNVIAAWSQDRDIHSAIHYLGSGWGPDELLVTVPALSQRNAHEQRDRFESAPLGPQAVASSPVGVGVDPYGLNFFTSGIVDGFDNIIGQGFGNPTANGCGGMITRVTARIAPAQGGSPGNACRDGGGQDPALNGDDGFIGPMEPPDGWQAGGWHVETQIVDGQEIYVVNTPGVDGIYTNLGDAVNFAQNYVYIPSGSFDPFDIDPSDLPDLPDDPLAGDPGADPDGDPGADPDADLGSGPDADIPSSEENQDTGPPPWASDYANAMSLLTRFERGEKLTRQERAQLTTYLSQHGPTSSPEALRNLFNRMENLPPNWRTPNITWLAGMTPGGFTQLQAQVAAQEAQIRAEAQQRDAAPQRNVSSGEQRQSPIASIGNYRDRINAELGIRLVQYYQTNNRNALAEGREYREEQVASIKEHEVRKGVGVVEGVMTLSDPVLPHSGEFVYEQTFLYIPGRGLDYVFRLNYHSQLIYDGSLGWGWEHTYDRRIVPASGGSLALKEGVGRFDVYSFDGTEFTPPAGRYTALVSDTAGISITSRSGSVESYYPLDSSADAGRLRTIADRNGNTLQFAYDENGRLETVTDALGRTIAYAYDGSDRISSVTDFDGRSMTLTYDDNGDLVSITTPPVTVTLNGNHVSMGKTTMFSYTSGFDDERLNHNLTTIIAPNEVADGSLTPRTINTYGTEGIALDRIVSQLWGGGRANGSGIPAGGEVTFVYTTAIAIDAPAGAASKVTVTDRGGNEIELWHDGAGHRLESRQTVGGEELVTKYAYNIDGQMTSVTYPAGNRAEYVYDDGATDRHAHGNLLESRFVADAARGCDGLGGTPCADLVTTYTYEPDHQLLQSVTDPRGATTTYARDDWGNLMQVTFPTVTVGAAAQQAATNHWTYNARGQPLTFTDAEGNVTCYEYDSNGYRQRVIRDCGPSTRSGQALGVTIEYGYDSVGNLTTITDSLGVRTEYVFNALNQAVKKTEAAGTGLDYETLYWYDANDNLVRTDVENVASDLDADFHPVGTLAPTGLRPTGAHSRDGANPWFTTINTYDLLDNLVRRTTEVTVSSQITIECRYDPLENLISVTDPRGNRVEYVYDERSLPREVIGGVGSPEAFTTTYEYDDNGNTIQFTDGEGNLTDYVYDGFDRRVGYIDALGNVRVWEYDENGNIVVTSLRDGQDGRNPGRVITAAAPVTLTHNLSHFDERNRLYRREQEFFTADVGSGVITGLTTDGNGDGWGETAFTYDRNSNLTAITDDNGNTTQYAFDGLGQLILTTDALNNTSAFAYDGNGNLTQMVATERQPDSLTADEIFTTTFTFDEVNRLIQTTSNPSAGVGQALGQTTRNEYDSRGNLVFTSDPNGVLVGETNDHGNTALFAYDGLGRTVEKTYHLRAGGVGEGAVTGQVRLFYAYDGSGNLTRRSDPNGNVTTYGYDALNRLTGVTYADETTDALVYDGAGNLVQQTDANGNVVTHTYDALNRLVRSDVTPGVGVGGTTFQTFAWDGLSRQIAISDDNDPATSADDSDVAFTYDSLSNRLSEIQGGHTISSTFDGAGNRLSLIYPGGTVVTYTHDALNRVETVADDDGEVAAYDYIGPSRLFRRTNGNGTYAAYAYDRARRVTGVEHRLSSDDSLLTSFSYTYDRVGNRTTETAQPGDATTTYTYDSLYRLTGAQGPSSSFQYAYDAAGNRTRATEGGGSTPYATNKVNAYLTVGGETRTYDANGNLLSRRFITQEGEWFIYLPLVVRGFAGSVSNNHAPVVPDSLALNGATIVTETVISYEYDFANRLLGTRKEITVTTDADVQVVTETVRFTYDGLGRRASKQTSDSITRYIYDGRRVIEERDGTDALLTTYVERLKMDGGGSHVVLYQTDALGSVRALADETGSVVERVDYGPFGAPILSGGGSASSQGNPYLFRGLRYDAESGFYLAGVRQYEPSTGRHAQRGEPSLGNPYTFAGNNPVNFGPR